MLHKISRTTKNDLKRSQEKNNLIKAPDFIEDPNSASSEAGILFTLAVDTDIQFTRKECSGVRNFQLLMSQQLEK